MSLLDTASLIVTPNGYKEGTLYSVIPSDGSGDTSVVRATTATRVDSAGLVESVANNIPRLDYSNGTCPSLLVEPQRTNLLPYSEQFTISPWLPYNSTLTANTIVAPNGVTSADTLTSNASTGGDVFQLITLNGTYTATAYFKEGNTSSVIIGYSNGVYSTFNLSTQTFVVTGSGTSTIEDAGNGWYRCSLTTSITAGIYVAFSSAATSGKYVYLWGAQLEVGSYATSYIPTTSASVTRNADDIKKTGVSSLIGQTEGTLFSDSYINISNNQLSGLLGITNTVENFIYLFYIGNQVYQQTNIGGALNTTYIATIPSSGRYKIALAYKSNDFSFYINGIQVWQTTTASVPACSDVSFQNATLGINSGSNINATALWKTRLTNTQLAQLTTI